MAGYATGDLSVAICDRCKMKRKYLELGPDGNSPGLMVCQTLGCRDELDPWRLPPRRAESIALRNARPDVSIANDQSALETGEYGQSMLTTEDGDILVP